MTVNGVSASRVLSAALPAAPGPGDGQGFRRAMGSFPSPVSIVTALDRDGVPRGLTCSAVCSVSMAPPSLLICVNKRNGTLDAIRDSGGFVVNLLREGRHATSDVFASSSAHKFVGVRWKPSAAFGLPLLVDHILAFAECSLHTEITAGTHAILIGLVHTSGRVSRESGPLVYYDRTYGRWALPEVANGVITAPG
jgi:flavin reductase (DIM6/NTAB) family NADH-FMN oxidoreductase RutF